MNELTVVVATTIEFTAKSWVKSGRRDRPCREDRLGPVKGLPLLLSQIANCNKKVWRVLPSWSSKFLGLFWCSKNAGWTDGATAFVTLHRSTETWDKLPRSVWRVPSRRSRQGATEETAAEKENKVDKLQGQREWPGGHVALHRLYAGCSATPSVFLLSPSLGQVAKASVFLVRKSGFALVIQRSKSSVSRLRNTILFSLLLHLCFYG
jgi:hypothetical protein